jgi:hypothetical protein
VSLTCIPVRKYKFVSVDMRRRGEARRACSLLARRGPR